MKKMNMKELLKSLAELAGNLRQTIEAQVLGFDANEKAKAERRQKVLDPVTGFEFFCRTYFPHYVRHESKSQLHEHLFKRLPEIAVSSRSEADAIAAPRGEAKSTYVTQLYPLWRMVTKRTSFVVIVMDSIDQAYPMLEAIKAELAYNPRLLMDFPEATGAGRVWQAGTIVTAGNVKVQVAGSGKKLRGLRHGPYRPDLVVLDDIENDEQVRSPEQRDKIENWVKKTIMPLGGVGSKCDIVYIGTILHYDSVLSRTLSNPFWRRIKLKAVITWPTHMDLWEKWEEVYRNPDLGAEIAEAYYLKNKLLMDAGAVTSWEARPIYDLMVIRARDGHDTFDSEYQNDPVSAENAIFANCIHFWVNRLSEWVFYGSCDPSLGKAAKGRDPSAILVGGFNRHTGILDVVEAAIKKRLPDRIIEDVIAFQKEYRCLLWGVESVAFQEFLRTELVKRSAKQGVPVPARGISPGAAKELRIESLQPHMANELIRIHSSHTVLQSQLRHYPMADHDDGPDALHMLWMIAVSGVNANYQGYQSAGGRGGRSSGNSGGFSGGGRGAW